MAPTLTHWFQELGFPGPKALIFASYFFFFKPFFCLPRKWGACVGEEANLGSKLFQGIPAARTKEKQLKRPLFYCSWRACWGPRIPAPHDTFCLWLLEKKTLTLTTRS